MSEPVPTIPPVPSPRPARVPEQLPLFPPGALPHDLGDNDDLDPMSAAEAEQWNTFMAKIEADNIRARRMAREIHDQNHNSGRQAEWWARYNQQADASFNHPDADMLPANALRNVPVYDYHLTPSGRPQSETVIIRPDGGERFFRGVIVAMVITFIAALVLGAVWLG